MKKVLLFGAALALVIFVTPGCSEKMGCTDSHANNFDSEAEKDDGSCTYNGCTDTSANNFNQYAQTDDGSCTYTAGLGGQVTIVAYATHHGDTIPSDTLHLDSAYVKFNSSNFPGANPADYDLVVVGEAGEDHIHLEDLKRGQYYIYMVGWDYNAVPGPGPVRGGIPYTVTVSSGEIDLVVPVSE